MEETTNPISGINEALDSLLNVAQLAVTADDRIANIEASDGMKAPVAILPSGEGRMAVTSLVSHMRDAHALMEQLRIEKAVRPDFRTGTANHQSLESFIAHVLRFKDTDSAIWAHAEGRTLVSVLDYHHIGAQGSPRWGRHKGVYSCPLSEAWTAWGGLKGLNLDQDDFATLLDSRDRELIGGKLPNGTTAPDPSKLVSLASQLEVFSTATAKRARDPSTGRLRISYSEESGLKEDITPPSSFLIHIPIFRDGRPQELEMRLRVNVVDAKAQFQLNIHAASEVLRLAFEEVCDKVRRATELPLFVGTPESA